MTGRDLFGHQARHTTITGEEYAVEVLHETLDGIKVLTATVENDPAEFWLPKSQIAVRPLRSPHAMITIPDWLAREKKLIE